MKRMIVPACLALVGLIAPRLGAAQDVAITNARVIVGSGQVIESGTIIVRGGKIVSVTAGAAPTQGLRTLDAKGMSAMPGFIDGHKHVANGENAAAQAPTVKVGYTPTDSFAALFSPRFSRRTITMSLLFMVSIIGLWAGSIYVPTAVTQIALREGHTLADSRHMEARSSRSVPSSAACWRRCSPKPWGGARRWRCTSC